MISDSSINEKSPKRKSYVSLGVASLQMLTFNTLVMDKTTVGSPDSTLFIVIDIGTDFLHKWGDVRNTDTVLSEVLACK